MSKLLSAALCSLVVALASPRARAEKSRLLYSREGNAERCPDEEALRAALHARLGYDAFSPWGERAVVVEISGDAAQLRARVRLLDEKGMVVGTREVRAASYDCEELMRSLALSISIALDPLAPPPSPEPAKASATEDEPSAPAETPAQPEVLPPPAPKRDEPSPRVAPPPRRSKLHAELALRLGPLVHAGFGPGSSPFGARLGFAVERGAARLVVDATATAPMSIASELGGEAHLQLSAASLAPCYVHGFIAGCGVFMVGRTSSWASGAPNTRSDSAVYLALGARVEARAPISKSFHLVFAADGLRNLEPLSVQLHEQILWKSGNLAGSVTISGAVAF